MCYVFQICFRSTVCMYTLPELAEVCFKAMHTGLVSSLDFIHLKTLSDQWIQDRKLFLLLFSKVKLVNSVNPDKVIFNFSKCLTTNQEKSIFTERLNFSIPPKTLDCYDFLAPFELLYCKLNEKPISPSSGFYPDFIKTKVKDIALSGLKSYHYPSSQGKNSKF